MADVRMLVSWGETTAPPTDRYSNTLYFSVDNSPLDPAGYQKLADDLRDIYAARFFTSGCKIEVRAYDMADAKPRPERAFSTVTRTGSITASAPQVAVCLSYYSGRNLPRNRGRIYTGPYTNTARLVPATIQDDLIAMGQAFANLGGVNVDWSVWSPTTAAGGGDGSKSISDIWVDNSWDIVRSRKLKGTARKTATINE